MSIEDPEEGVAVLVDEPTERSLVLPIVAGAALLLLLVGAQLGVAAADSDPATPAAGADQVSATSAALVAPSPDATTGLPEPAVATTAGAEPEAAGTGAPGTAAAEPAAPEVPAPAEPEVAAPAEPEVAEPAAPETAAPGEPASPVDPRRAELQQELDEAGPVTFDPVTGEPTEDRTAVLNDVAAAVLAAGDLPVAVVGRAVPSGDPAADEAASLELAESVLLSLRLRMVPTELLVAESAGTVEDQQAAGGDRVDFRVLPAS